MRFLSDDWLEALDRAGADVVVEPPVDMVVEQTVRRAEGDVVWHAAVSRNVRIRPGPAPAAAVRLSCDETTARAIASGAMSAQRAFLDGRLQLGGDVQALIAGRSALEALNQVHASLGAELDDR